MITLYAWPTPNAHKVSIMLEECGLAYEVSAVDITAGDQFEPEFLTLSPNNRMPALVDDEGPDGQPISIFESGAILIYLADKTKKFMPEAGNPRYDVMQWLMFQMANLGPICGQAHHFRDAAPERVPYAINRFTDEAGRLYGVMDRRLAEVAHLAGEDYSIADMACWPWIRVHRYHGQPWEDYPNVKRWFDEIATRPAVQEGMKLLSEKRAKTRDVLDEQARDILFGEIQMARR
ncbi:MAG: glutathione S-transferase [Rhodospirillaceae bacterium]|nr:glutathione S-transferase [Rhodospirillaceae bacterium]|tara:strand:+ start:5585 stop:6286 length:702 start_codon:yes stop_codon:yes gene_type:complete